MPDVIGHLDRFNQAPIAGYSKVAKTARDHAGVLHEVGRRHTHTQQQTSVSDPQRSFGIAMIFALLSSQQKP